MLICPAQLDTHPEYLKPGYTMCSPALLRVMPSEEAVRQEAGEAARSAIVAVWERHISQMEARFDL